MKEIYRSHMRESCVNNNDYLDMGLYLSVDGEIRVMMKDHLNKILSDFPEKIQGRVVTPASEHPFTVRDDADRKLLYKEKSIEFHHAVTQLFFDTTRFRKNIHTSVTFITKRARIPGKDDWQKLLQVLQHIISTIHMPLLLSVDKLSIVKRWVDASYAMHPDCWSHIGATVSLV